MVSNCQNRIFSVSEQDVSVPNQVLIFKASTALSPESHSCRKHHAQF